MYLTNIVSHQHRQPQSKLPIRETSNDNKLGPKDSVGWAAKYFHIQGSGIEIMALNWL
jgi:hypothetical protein